jgi:hypothetical protein
VWYEAATASSFYTISMGQAAVLYWQRGIFHRLFFAGKAKYRMKIFVLIN